jgi:putative addiction module killer protein
MLAAMRRLPNGLRSWSRWRAPGLRVPLARMEQGNFSNAKGVGEGVLEYKIDFGPGYRVYFGRDGDTIVILLTGGTKKRQQRDIDTAKAYWRDYKLSKRGRR